MNFAFIQLALFALLELALCYVVGRICYALVRLQPQPLHHAVAPALGLSILALQLWLYGWLHLPWNAWLLLAPWAIAAFFTRQHLSLHKKRFLSDWHSLIRWFRALDPLSKTFIALGVLFLGVFLVRLVVSPLLSSDTMGFWSLKAKEFFYHHGVFVDPFLYRTHESSQFFHVDYPPLWPLMADVGYVLLGHMQETVQKTNSWILCVSAVAATFVFARQWLGREGQAVAVAFIVLAAPQFLQVFLFEKNMAYADYPLAAFMLLSGIFLVRSLHSVRLNADWALALFFASIAGVIKNEGIPFFATVFVVCCIRLALQTFHQRISHARFFAALSYITIVLLPLLAWTLYKRSHRLEVEFHYDNLAASGMGAGERLSIVASETATFIKTNTPYWWEIIALGLGAVAAFWQRRRESLMVLLIILAMLASYTASFLFSAHELHYHVSSSIDRLFIQVLPLIVLLLVTALRPKSGPTAKHIV